MCLAVATIDERIGRLQALLAAAKNVTAANQEAGAENFAGTLVLLQEVERDLATFAFELKASASNSESS